MAELDDRVRRVLTSVFDKVPPWPPTEPKANKWSLDHLAPLRDLVLHVAKGLQDHRSQASITVGTTRTLGALLDEEFQLYNAAGQIRTLRIRSFLGEKAEPTYGITGMDDEAEDELASLKDRRGYIIGYVHQGAVDALEHFLARFLSTMPD